MQHTPSVEGVASQQAHVILAVHQDETEQKVPVSILSWSGKKIKSVVCGSLAAETSSMATFMEHLDWKRTLCCQTTTAKFSLDNYVVALKKPRALLRERLQESARRDSQGRSRFFISGQATCD